MDNNQTCGQCRRCNAQQTIGTLRCHCKGDITVLPDTIACSSFLPREEFQILDTKIRVGDIVETCSCFPGLVVYVDPDDEEHIEVQEFDKVGQYIPGRGGNHTISNCGIVKISGEKAAYMMALGREKVTALYSDESFQWNNVSAWRDEFWHMRLSSSETGLPKQLCGLYEKNGRRDFYSCYQLSEVMAHDIEEMLKKYVSDEDSEKTRRDIQDEINSYIRDTLRGMEHTEDIKAFVSSNWDGKLRVII